MGAQAWRPSTILSTKHGGHLGRKWRGRGGSWVSGLLRPPLCTPSTPALSAPGGGQNALGWGQGPS